MYGGFQACYTVCGQADGSEQASATCLASCFSDYESCAQPCLASGVQIACTRLADGQNCYPEPFCRMRERKSSQNPHAVPAFLRTSKRSHVVKGSHYQIDRACEVRSTKRHGAHAASSLVGFRCALIRSIRDVCSPTRLLHFNRFIWLVWFRGVRRIGRAFLCG